LSKITGEFEAHVVAMALGPVPKGRAKWTLRSTQCLGKQRINSVEELNEVLSAWEVDRNTRQKGVNWQFTTEDARIKLKRLYPTPLFE
jgi:hypothetical protein